MEYATTDAIARAELRRLAKWALERAARFYRAARTAIDRYRAGRSAPEARGRPASPLAETMLTVGEDPITVGDLTKGCAIVGVTGSGKTSGSIDLLMATCFNKGLGGLVCLGKAEDAARVAELLHRSNRSNDAIWIGPDYPARFDVWGYARTLSRGRVDTLVDFWIETQELVDREAGSNSSDAFWVRYPRILLRAIVDVFEAAGQPYSIRSIADLHKSIPSAEDAARHFELVLACARGAAGAEDELIALHDGSVFFDVLGRANARRGVLDAYRLADLDESNKLLFRYASSEDRLRTSVDATITSLISALTTGPYARIFGSGVSDFDLEDTYRRGGIVVLNSPVIRDRMVGKMNNCSMIYAFDRCIQDRDPAADGGAPVFKFVDECQYVITRTSAQVQATVRSSRMMTFMAAQSPASFVAAIGKDHAQALLSNLSNKIVHALGDADSARWASEQIGHEFKLLGGGGGDRNRQSYSYSESRQFRLEPDRFFTLRTGGVHNDGKVEAIWLRPGQPFRSGAHWIPVTFVQQQVRGA